MFLPFLFTGCLGRVPFLEAAAEDCRVFPVRRYPLALRGGGVSAEEERAGHCLATSKEPSLRATKYFLLLWRRTRL